MSVLEKKYLTRENFQKMQGQKTLKKWLIMKGTNLGLHLDFWNIYCKALQ